MTQPANDRIKLQLRINETLRQRLAEEAKRSVRSLNAEIIYRLRSSFERQQNEAAAS